MIVVSKEILIIYTYFVLGKQTKTYHLQVCIKKTLIIYKPAMLSKLQPTHKYKSANWTSKAILSELTLGEVRASTRTQTYR